MEAVTAIAALAEFYQADGYMRGPIPERLLQDGWRHYKKGWEIRISLPDDHDVLRTVQDLISAAGWTVAEPFHKHTRIIQPIYGREPVKAILKACGQELPD